MQQRYITYDGEFRAVGFFWLKVKASSYHVRWLLVIRFYFQVTQIHRPVHDENIPPNSMAADVLSRISTDMLTIIYSRIG